MNDEQLLRYSRQIMLPQIDVAGQQRLREAHIVIVGLGGLGSPVAMYLAAAGVGRLTLVDGDRVDLSNLQRQIVHRTDDVGQPKVASAMRGLAALNPDVAIEPVFARADENALRHLVTGATACVDCSDNFTTRFALNRACRSARTPLVSGAAIRFSGQVTVFDPAQPASPCYRCLFDEVPETEEACAQSGVFTPLVGVVGSIQATEALKLAAGVGRPLVGRMLLIEAEDMELREIRLRRDPQCPACGAGAKAAATAAHTTPEDMR